MTRIGRRAGCKPPPSGPLFSQRGAIVLYARQSPKARSDHAPHDRPCRDDLPSPYSLGYNRALESHLVRIGRQAGRRSGVIVSHFESLRHRMVEEQLVPRGIRDERVLAAMRTLPRHRFVEPALQNQAYDDTALPIGEDQTISQPYIVALMTEGLALKGGEKVLEIGTGSGYQCAVLSRLAAEVYSIERIAPLLEKARKILKELTCGNIVLRLSDGTSGWSEAAPFDAILVAAGGPEIPQTLIDQLRVGGRLVMPIGSRRSQILKRIVKKKEGWDEEALTACAFVPLIGDWGWPDHEGRA